MANQKRSEKLERLVKMQRHLERMAENELAATTRARSEVQENLSAVVDAIGSMSPIHQIFSGLYSNQIGRLTAKDQHLETVQQIHENRMLRERTKGDRLDEKRSEVLEDERREAEDQEIFDLMDQRILLESYGSKK